MIQFTPGLDRECVLLGGRASPSRGRKSGPRHDPLCWRDGLECTRMDNGHWRVDPRWTRTCHAQ